VRKLEEFNAQERMEIALLDQHVHFLVGEIDTDSIYECIRWITYENLDAKTDKTLTLYINSTGGDLYEAFALIDVMQSSKHPIRDQKMVDILRSATELTPSKIKTKLLPASDVYLTAQELLEFGVADYILNQEED